MLADALKETRNTDTTIGRSMSSQYSVALKNVFCSYPSRTSSLKSLIL